MKTVKDWDKKTGDFFVESILFSVKRDLTEEEKESFEKIAEKESLRSPVVVGGFLLAKEIPFSVKRKYRKELGFISFFEANITVSAINCLKKREEKQKNE